MIDLHILLVLLFMVITNSIFTCFYEYYDFVSLVIIFVFVYYYICIYESLKQSYHQKVIRFHGDIMGIRNGASDVE